jgi:nucleoside-diphosphate-sugar epimerase
LAKFGSDLGRVAGDGGRARCARLRKAHRWTFGGARDIRLKRVLITGASGFVGRALVAHLAKRGYAVRAASRRPVAASDGVEHVSSPDLARECDWGPLLGGVDAIVHAAAIAHTNGVDEAAHEAVNHRAVAALAAVSRGRAERLVFLSSIRAQSGAAAARILTEDQDPRPTDAYGRAKLAAEEALARMRMPHVILRPVLVVGSPPSGNLATMLRLARLKLPLPFGAFAARRSLVARADLCAAIEHVLVDRAHLGRTYIVAHPEPIGIGSMFAALREGLGREPGLFAFPSPLLRVAMAVPGMSGVRDKLLGDLIASSAKLMATSWAPNLTPRTALAEIGAAAFASGAERV